MTNRLMRLALIALVPLLSFCGDDDGGSGDTDMGMTELDMGMTDPDMGTTDPDMGMVDPDMGMVDPDMGMVDPDMGIDMGPPTVVSIAIDPATATVAVDATQELTVNGTFSDDSMMALTEGVLFASSDDAVATVDAAGVVTGVAAGTADITATLDGLEATATITVLRADFVVFDDALRAGVSLADFGGSANAVTVSDAEFFGGAASLSIPVPASGFTGGTYVIDAPVDLSGYDVVRFAVRATEPDKRLNVAGIGNDSADNFYNTELNVPGGPGIPITTTWTEYTIPIPDPSRATDFVGLFHFAESDSEGPYLIYIDEIRYVDLPDGAVSNPRPNIANEIMDLRRTIEVGQVVDVNGESCTFDVEGADVFTNVTGIGFFDVTSSDAAVAGITGAPSNRIEALTPGTADITASLLGVMAGGINGIEVVPAPPSETPDVAAPTPTVPAADVISLYSDSYTDVPVDTFRTPWSNTGMFREEEYVTGNNARAYEDVVFFGIETVGPNSIDLTGITHFHVDVWFEGSSATRLGIGIVDFGADNAFGGMGADADVRGDVAFFDTSMPPLSPGGSWQSFDIPIADFVGLATIEHVSQYIFVTEPAGTSNIWIDNMYFYTAAP
ncbi:MAG: Ig-like domain-containing protein [Myxococcota bacterium]